MTSGDEPLAMSPACPICNKPQDPAYRPFCSKRCADVDLQRWLTGGYSIGGRDQEEPDESLLRPAPELDDED